MNSRYPFPGFVLFLAIGILFGNMYGKGIEGAHVLACGLGVILICLGILSYAKRQNTGVAVAMTLLLMISGFLSVAFRNSTWDEQIDSIQAREYTHYEGLVTAFPEKRKKSVRIQLDLERVRSSVGWVTVDSKALVYLSLNSTLIPQPGDRILIKGKLEIPKAPLNPGEFDYKKFLRQRGILWTAFLPDGNYTIIAANRNGLRPALWSLAASKWADDLFKASLKDDRAYGLIKAMLLGRRDDLHAEQVDDYTASGTVHILSVSGMHVALIFLVLSVLLGWMKKLRGGKYIYLLSITSILFFYALVTGFSPSVQRSMLMCVVLVVADVFRKGGYPINTLGFSALLILLMDPFALYDVGFQLSYAAMLGIFLFYRPIESFWLPRGWVWKNLWQVTVMSFAAQLATFPLSVYYFHQFPTYFWLVNPFVIFWTNLLLPAAMLLLGICAIPIPYLDGWAAWVVEWLAYLTDFCAGAVKVFPYYLIENLVFDQIEVGLLYIVILMAWWVYETRRTRMLKSMLLAMAIFAMYGISTSAQKYLFSEVVFHAIPRHSVVSLKSGDTLFVLADNRFSIDSAAFRFHIKNYAVNAGVLKVVSLNALEVGNSPAFNVRWTSPGMLLDWHDETIFIGDRIPGVGGIDYMMVSGNKPAGKMNFVTKFPIILAGELSRRNSESWRAALERRNSEVSDLMIGGAQSIR